jgi:hypothetical protein
MLCRGAGTWLQSAGRGHLLQRPLCVPQSARHQHTECKHCLDSPGGGGRKLSRRRDGAGGGNCQFIQGGIWFQREMLSSRYLSTGAYSICLAKLSFTPLYRRHMHHRQGFYQRGLTNTFCNASDNPGDYSLACITYTPPRKNFVFLFFPLLQNID